MKQKIIISFLLLGCVVSGVFGFFIYTMEDHKAPEIKIEKEKITYTQGDEYDSLLEGVTAKDNIDGDVSDQVFVDKVVPAGTGKAVVYYGAMDKRYNVGTGKRTVNYIQKEEEESEDIQDTDVSAEEEPVDDTSDKEETKEDIEDDTAEEKEKEDKKEEELKPDGENPAISLTKKKVKIKAGENFNVLDMVKEVVDDKDDSATLYQYIHADGQYDTNKKGVYKLTYYVTDSEKNASEKQTLTLTVE